MSSPGRPRRLTVDLSGVTAKYVRLTANSNWNLGGWLSQYGLSEVRFHYIPLWAREPDPADGAIDVDPDLVLDWRAGREAATHDVHLSSDRDAVLSGAAHVGSAAEAGYDAGALDLGRTYYWRVDEVDEAQSPALEGELWGFTTPNYLIVENFEDYNDYPPREIWTTWADGYNDPTNGASAGHANPDWLMGEHYAETTIVHGGDQSMPLFYDNNFKYSQVERTLSPPQDWTSNGITTLSLSFFGDPQNAVEQMYLKFNVIDKGNTWHWDEVHSNSHDDKVVKFTLSAGEHRLEIARRDDYTLLDCILITDELDLDQKSLPHVIP